MTPPTASADFSASASAASSEPSDGATAPRADCIADSAGGLTFDVTDHGGPDPAHLVLTDRDSGEDVRLPLTPAGDGSLRAALPSSVRLPEGRWDVFAQVAGEEPQRLAPGLNDLRSLVDRVPSGSAASSPSASPTRPSTATSPCAAGCAPRTPRRANCSSRTAR